jgi:hypothetical protein
MFTAETHTVISVVTLASLYFVIGQALAHPIHLRLMKTAHARKLPAYPAQIRMGLSVLFGFAWPYMMLQFAIDRVIFRRERKSKSDSKNDRSD